jgi:phosphoribosylformylglycinamidine synthase
MFVATIRITLKPKVNDPQGQTVMNSLKTLGFSRVTGVRIGKYIEVFVDDVDKDKADQQIRTICNQLLANPVIEEFQYEINPVK